jgi:hypothetical protein
VKLQVVAINPGVEWTSDPSNALTYTRSPSKTQTCTEPPKLTLPATLASTLKGAQHSHWVETLRFHASGIGALRVTLTFRTAAGRSSTVRRKLAIKRAGNRVLHLTLPRSVRAVGSGSVTFRQTSPDGKHHRLRIVKIEVSA